MEPIYLAPLIDSHAHLYVQQFDADRNEMLVRARRAGVTAVVMPATSVNTARRIVRLAAATAQPAGEAERAGEPRPRLYGAVGVHPTSSAAFADAIRADRTIEELRELSAQPGVVAIGEIGLDNHWKEVEPALQHQALERQLALAAEVGKPVLIHSREANAQVAAVLRAWVAGSHFRSSRLAQRPFAGVLHAFSGDLALAEEAWAWGFALSLGGPVTFKSAAALHALAARLDFGRLMLETDAPWLTPHPLRGKRNEPALLPLVCEALAQWSGRTPAEVAALTTTTANRFFGLESGTRL